MTTRDRDSLRRALSEAAEAARQALLFDREDGRDSIEVEPAVVTSLGRPPASAPTDAPPPACAAPAAASPSSAAPDAEAAIRAIAAEVAQCRLCPLARTRNRTVPGQGSPRAEVMFVGEGPGHEEDRQGIAFIGPAGQLLTRLIRRMGYSREDVFIANIVKCRPTEDFKMRRDRPPTPEEMATCIPYLQRQIDAIHPKVIVALGGTAVAGLLNLTGISRLRGQWHQYRGIPVMPTYHPSYLLRGGGENKARYWDVWEDMQKVLERIGRKAPDKA